MTSISPVCGQPTSWKSLPRVQNAGHRPSPAGTWMRDSMRPYRNSFLPSVERRAEVYSHAVPVGRHHRVGSSFSRTVMARFSPSVATLSVPGV